MLPSELRCLELLQLTAFNVVSGQSASYLIREQVDVLVGGIERPWSIFGGIHRIVIRLRLRSSDEQWNLKVTNWIRNRGGRLNDSKFTLARQSSMTVLQLRSLMVYV